jgi:amidase
VRDAALLLGCLTGLDPNDAATEESRGKAYSDYTQFCKPDGLRGARLGIARQYFEMGPQVATVMDECLDVLRHAGAVLIDPVRFHELDAWREEENTVLLYEFKDGLNKYLAGRGGRVNSLAACIAFNREHAAEEMPFFRQELMEQAQETGTLHDKKYREALAKCRKLSRHKGIDELCHKHSLDAIVAPTAGPAFVTDLINGDRIDSGCASPAAVAGYPHITVPAGAVSGLPIGLSFFSTAWNEPKLIAVAYAFEQARQARRKPEFLPAVRLNA